MNVFCTGLNTLKIMLNMDLCYNKSWTTGTKHCDWTLGQRFNKRMSEHLKEIFVEGNSVLIDLHFFFRILNMLDYFLLLTLIIEGLSTIIRMYLTGLRHYECIFGL